MNGAQIHKFLLKNPGKTARDIVNATGDGRMWHVNRECSRHSYIYIKEWVKEWDHRQQDHVWVPVWSAVEIPQDAPQPQGVPA